MATQTAKAVIVNLRKPNDPIPCLFNPNQYSFSKSNSWNPGKVKGGNVPQLEFGGGESMTLTMELFFDTYDTDKDRDRKEDVRKYTDKIWQLMMVPKGKKGKDHKSSPPLCEFRWGRTWSFSAVITSISQTFTLFLADGTPVRSTMNVTFKQALEEGRYPGQNPTTVSVPGYKVRHVREGETMDLIAFEEYGDCALWRVLADVNNIDNPLALKGGQLLAIPPAR
jgi:hypothetical protein